jgi:hypothetical protein
LSRLLLQPYKSALISNGWCIQIHQSWLRTHCKKF